MGTQHPRQQHGVAELGAGIGQLLQAYNGMFAFRESSIEADTGMAWCKLRGAFFGSRVRASWAISDH